MSATATVEISGHIIDSLILAKVLDIVVDAGADYRLLDIDIGRRHTDPSSARIELTAPDPDALEALLGELHPHGAHPVEEPDARLETCEEDGVLPEGFYSTTNLPTRVKVDGERLHVENPEMDCALVVDDDRARTVPVHRVRRGDRVVVGHRGVTVEPLAKPRGPKPAGAAGLRGPNVFEFMDSEVSSEKPKGLLVGQVAGRVRAAKEGGGKVLAVCGPAVVHTGAAPAIASLIRDGWVDVLFAGNGFAVHDVESALLGTSLGISVQQGTPTEGGHANHIRAINTVRRWGSIRAGVESGELTSGVMYECIERDVPYVLGGSVRDDGPLPDTVTDVVAAQDAMRELTGDVRVALMLASTLHAIATGNILPATVETYCVDINQAVVTKLADRGSHQALGIVTDVGLFVRELAGYLCR